MSPTSEPAIPSRPQPPQSPNYLKWVLIGCSTLFVIGGGTVLLAAIWYFSARPTSQSNTSGSRPTLPGRKDVKLVSDHGVETVAKMWSSCSAFAPADWTITGNEQHVGIGVDLAAPDRMMFASYGIVSLARTDILGGDYYGTGTPEVFLKNAIESTGASGFDMDNESQPIEGGYTLRYWRANYQGKPFRGFALYQAIETGDPTNYILAYRLGSSEAGKWDEAKHVVYDIAASIRCTKHLFPVQQSASSREPQGTSKDQVDEELSTKREETTMGFQNVYSPSTGQHWEASYSDYNPTGPDGPGYYRRVGNSYEKLNEGFPPN